VIIAERNELRRLLPLNAGRRYIVVAANTTAAPVALNSAAWAAKRLSQQAYSRIWNQVEDYSSGMNRRDQHIIDRRHQINVAS